LALGIALATLQIFCGYGSAVAATFQQVGHFAGSTTLPPEPGVFPEEVQLAGAGGLAVNVSGAGGVAPGTVYAATRGAEAGEKVRIAVYKPVLIEGTRKLMFSKSWEVRPAEEPYDICGPDSPSPASECAARPRGNPGTFWDVDVDQATGNVYVLIAGTNLGAGTAGIVEYSPDGAKVITRFGEIAEGGETTAMSPGKIHGSFFPGGIAVDASGNVYVFDLNGPNNFYHRLMVFKPKTPGKYDEYEYAGQSKDIGAGFLGETNYPSLPAVDENGNVYVAGETYVEEYDPTQPSKAICKVALGGQAITAITVDPKTGEVFYFSYKQPKRIHQLAPCKGGTFEEPEPAGIEVAPERDDLSALAFDPLHKFDEAHDVGALYGAAPGPVPLTGGKGQKGASALGYIFAPVAEDPPSVLSESVTRITATSAELQTGINPKSSLTRYVFQYLTASAYDEAGEEFIGASEVPPGGGLLGGGSAPLTAAALVNGLERGTEYVFRVVATSNCKKDPEIVCESVGEPLFFSTYPDAGLGLSDGRAYELVSPAQKSGGEVFPAEPNINSCLEYPECKPGDSYQHFPMQSAPGGNAVLYEGFSFAPGTGAAIEDEYLARRGETGWQSSNLTPPNLESKGGQGYKLFDPGFAQGIIEQPDPPLVTSAPAGYPSLNLQPTASPTTLTSLLTDEPLNHLPFNRATGNGVGRLSLALAGASADSSRVFFEANDALTEAGGSAPEAVDGGEKLNNLYEWSGGQLRLVNVAPENSETTPGAALGSGTLLGGGTNNIPVSVFTHAISDDGSRAFWTGANGKTYARVSGTESIEVKGPGSCKASVPTSERVCFLAATPDGSRVLLSDGRIYQLDEAGEGYDPSIDLTNGKGGFQGLVGQTNDLAHLYFVDTAVLTEEVNSGGGKAQAGKDNLYFWKNGSVNFVATLAAGDKPSWEFVPALRMGEASPNGEWLSFLSKAPLTGYDNVGPCTQSSEGPVQTPCNEVFLYDAATGELSCVSCNPTGVAPLGNSILRLILNVKGSLPQPRYLTDAGRLFFDSADSLVAADSNHGVEDVYQFEPSGVGSCQREAGCVSLISAGREGIDSNFVAMDSTGDNVFFTTRDRLVPADSDQLMDLYDARVSGGFETESQLPPLPCQGEACQAPSPPAPQGPPPGSQSFEGPGNPKPAKTGCKKGQVKKKGKCVKKNQGKKKRANARKQGGAR
jgi:phage terminase large subunit-like protein